MPEKKQQTFRLSDQVLDALQRIAEVRGMSRPEVLELAVTHLDGTLRNGQPVYLPPEPPKSHKRHRRVA